MEVEIRACEPEDAAALSLVGQATFLETYAHFMPRADMLHHCANEHAAARYAGWLGKPGYRFWLAEAAGGGAPVGYIMLSPPDLPIPTGPDDVELKRIYLLHRLQGTGVGARLMGTAIEQARLMGARRLLLGVHGGNERAIAFYARHGFERAGVRTFQVGSSAYDDLVLARAL